MRSLITGGRGFVGHVAGRPSPRARRRRRRHRPARSRSPTPRPCWPAFGDARPDAVYHLAALTHVGSVVGRAAPGGRGQRHRHRGGAGRRPPVRYRSQGAGHQLGRGLRRGHGPDPATTDRAVRDGPPHALRGQQAGRRGPGGPGVAGARPARSITVRPFNHIGPGQTPNFAVAALAKRIVEAEGRRTRATIPVGNLSARRDFTDVRDVVRAYRLLIEVGRGPAGLQRVLGTRRGHRRHRRHPAVAGRHQPRVRDRPGPDATGRGARPPG